MLDSMHTAQFVLMGLIPTYDESWVFLDDYKAAKHAYLNPIPVPSELNLLATVSLSQALKQLCILSAYRSTPVSQANFKKPPTPRKTPQKGEGYE